jgi:hypothetical protein
MGTCDGCGTQKGRIRRVELGGGSGIFLCDACLKKEIAWRKERNRRLIKFYGSKKKAGKTLFRTKYKF